MSRPTDYHKSFPHIALCLESELQPTDEELARILGISRSTLNRWKKEHPEFWDAIRTGKKVAQKIVEHALFRRACGYEHPEDVIMQHRGEPVIVKTTKHYPPDTPAIKFWLSNIDPEHWQDKTSSELTGKGGDPLEIIIRHSDGSDASGS